MIRFTVASEVLRALDVFTDSGCAALGHIHVRATETAVMMESSDGYALLRVFPEVVFADDSDRVFDVLILISGFLPVLKAKPAKYAPKIVDITIDGQAVTMTCAGVSATYNVGATAQEYPNTDAIGNIGPSFAPVELLGLRLAMIRNIDKALSFLRCMGVGFTALDGENGVFVVARGESDFGLYELFFTPLKLPGVSDAEKKHYTGAQA